MALEQRVDLRFEDSIAMVKLNRPDKHNALDFPMFNAIANTIKQINKNKNVRVVIVSGAGENFCTGLDIKSVMHDRSTGLKLLWKWWPGHANLAQFVSIGWRKLKVPVIMVLHGKCWGGGMQIALGGDFRIASPETSLAIMESKWGIIPDMGGTPALIENVANDHALLMAMTGEPVTAEAALEYNLVTSIDKDPMQAAIKLATTLKERSPDTNKILKRFYHKAWSKRDSRILARETLYQWQILFGHNRKVAVKRAMGNKDISYK